MASVRSTNPAAVNAFGAAPAAPGTSTTATFKPLLPFGQHTVTTPSRNPHVRSP
jgi:hypothetical protein